MIYGWISLSFDSKPQKKFLVSQHGQLGAIPPPPFLSVSPLESMRSGGAIPPLQKGYLSDTGAIPYKNKPNGCDTPLCDTIPKGYCAIWGGISHWAAKPSCCHFSECYCSAPFRTKEKQVQVVIKTTLVWPCITVHGVSEQVSSSCGCRDTFRGESPVHMQLPTLNRGHTPKGSYSPRGRP